MADLATASLEEIRRLGMAPILVLEAREKEARRLAVVLEPFSQMAALCAFSEADAYRFAIDLLKAGATYNAAANAVAPTQVGVQ